MEQEEEDDKMEQKDLKEGLGRVGSKKRRAGPQGPEEEEGGGEGKVLLASKQ
jgi:hypothetical protein